MQVSNRLRTVIADLALPHARSKVAQCVTVSVGACTMVPERGLEAHHIISAADQQLYQAKTNGRNCVAGREVLGYAPAKQPI